ncbi:MAG: RNA methyltransferase [Oligoflexia bacterium]|nr:RNA methyltransferase [Oligoflexia bacterium]
MKNSDAKQRPHLAKDEQKYSGTNACIALFKNRPDDIVRAYIHKDLQEKYSELIIFCAKKRKSYHIVTDKDLEKLTESTHHQGICLVAQKKLHLSQRRFFSSLSNSQNLILYLDGVTNPHNFGAIIRSAAHFGVDYVIGDETNFPTISASAYRTSEGAYENVKTVALDDPDKAISQLKKLGFIVYGLDVDKEAKSIFDTRLSQRSVFVLGSETIGLSSAMGRILDTKLHIPGSGHIESLNVSVSAAVTMAEFCRQQNTRAQKLAGK